ncbi:MAG: hypothetical protein NT099_00585 [Candidatus Saganbacteria bacterium]|nr:hypothetical protein [Candidatus Saganbacteria bacterium]
MLKQEENKNNLGFKYERKRIKRDKTLPPLCPDYDPDSYGYCKKDAHCKNATHSEKDEASGFCLGGTKESEIKYRKENWEHILYTRYSWA